MNKEELLDGILENVGEEKIAVLKKIQELGLNQNDEVLAFLYAQTYAGYLVRDIPQSLEKVSESLDKLGIQFENTIRNQGDKFAEAVHKLVAEELSLMAEEHRKLMDARAEFVDELTAQVDDYKAQALKEIAKREEDFKKVAEDVKRRTTQTFLEALNKELDKQSNWSWARFGVNFSAVLAGLSVFKVLSLMF